jgi:hypothetical protein
MGVERYGGRAFSPEFLTPALFEYERFYDLQQADTFYRDLSQFTPYYDRLRKTYPQARFVGDKIPKLYERLPELAARFPSAKVVFLLRNIFDVALSYRRRAEDDADEHWRREHGVTRAIEDWRKSLAAFVGRPDGLMFRVVCYEEFFVKGEGLDDLLEFIGIRDRAPIINHFVNIRARCRQLESQRDRNLSCDEIVEICREAPFDIYRHVLKLSEQSGSSVASERAATVLERS